MNARWVGSLPIGRIVVWRKYSSKAFRIIIMVACVCVCVSVCSIYVYTCNCVYFWLLALRLYWSVLVGLAVRLNNVLALVSVPI